MANIDVNYINTKLFEKGDRSFRLADLEYPEVRTDGQHLLDQDGNPVGTKGDMYAKVMMDRLLREGCYDINPRPKYETDGKPANTLSLNNPGLFTYDISKGESPMMTLRPIAVKKSIGEVLWIYQDATTDLEVLKDNFRYLNIISHLNITITPVISDPNLVDYRGPIYLNEYFNAYLNSRSYDL